MRLLYTDETESDIPPAFFEKAGEAVLKAAGRPDMEDAEISLLLTTDEELRFLNRDYRHKDRPTDVLSFPMEEETMLGDVAISMDTAARQAEERGISLERETAFLYIHGFLHLLGYDHEKGPEEEAEMFALQEYILKKLIDCGLVS